MGHQAARQWAEKKESMECVAFIFIFKTMFWHFGIMKSQHFRFGFCCYASCIWNRISKSLDKSSEKRFSFQFTLVKSCSKTFIWLRRKLFYLYRGNYGRIWQERNRVGSEFSRNRGNVFSGRSQTELFSYEFSIGLVQLQNSWSIAEFNMVKMQHGIRSTLKKLLHQPMYKVYVKGNALINLKPILTFPALCLSVDFRLDFGQWWFKKKCI